MTAAKALLVERLLRAGRGDEVMLRENLAKHMEAVRDYEGAVAQLEAVLIARPDWAMHVRGRLFDISMGRFAYGDAQRQIEQLRRGVRTDRDHVLTDLRDAELARSVGRTTAAAMLIARARERLGSLPQRTVVDKRDYDYSSGRLALAELDLALVNSDDVAIAEIAAGLSGRAGLPPLMRNRLDSAMLLMPVSPSEREARIGRLYGLVDRVAPVLRPQLLLGLVEQLLVAGRVTEADAVAERILVDSPGELATDSEVVALAAVALRPSRLPTMPSDEIQRWLTTLDNRWQRLVQRWLSVRPDEAGVAFLFLRERRSLLSLWCRARLAYGGQAAVRDCLQRYLDTEMLGSTARRMKLEGVTVDDVTRTFGQAGELVLAYLPSFCGSFVFAISGGGVQIFEIASDADWLAPIRRVRQRLADVSQEAPGTQFGDDVAFLASVLIPPPVADMIDRCESLTFAGRDIVLGLRAECLPVAGGPLGLVRPVANVPSLVLGVILGRRSSRAVPASASALIGSDLSPNDMSRWGRVPVDVSAQAVESALRAVHPEAVHVVDGASQRDLLAPSKECAVQFVLAHGIYDGRRSRPAGLLLGAGVHTSGAIFAEDFIGSRRLSPVLFLGVCRAARAPARRGDDGGHRLAAAVLEAGSAAVVGSESDLRTDDTLVAMRAVAESLAGGASLAEAVRRARESLFRITPNPARWCALGLDGIAPQNLKLLPSPSSQPSAPLVVTIAVLGVCVLACRLIGRTKTLDHPSGGGL